MNANKILAAFLAGAVVAVVLIGCSKKTNDEFVQLSQVNMHYVTQGDGKQAVILLHGNGSNLNDLNGIAKKLSKDYTVYSLDSRCHGKSTDTEEITYDLMADDVYEFINELGVENPYIIGHSDGGIVALTLASKYPDSVGAVVACGANSNPQGLEEKFFNSIKKSNDKKPNKLYDLMLNYPDLTEDEFSKIKCPCLILAGEKDIVQRSDTEFIANSISDSRLIILKGENHSSYITISGKKAYQLSTDFFNSIN
ncbi:MAG: alpha/beta fold hydrolase [Eubacterium sp.]